MNGHLLDLSFNPGNEKYRIKCVRVMAGMSVLQILQYLLLVLGRFRILDPSVQLSISQYRCV